MSSQDETKRILDAQYSEDQPVVIDQDGNIHPASDGNKGLAISDQGGDYMKKAQSAAIFGAHYRRVR